jgi:hypothetical protein
MTKMAQPSWSVRLALLLIAGCSRPEPLIPVTGTLTVRKQPLAAGTIVFHPDRDKGNNDKREPRATIGEVPGVYQLTTDNKEGAPAGWYKVTVHALKSTSSARPSEWLADQRYADEKTSGLAAEVKEGPAASYDFDLDPPS